MLYDKPRQKSELRRINIGNLGILFSQIESWIKL